MIHFSFINSITRHIATIFFICIAYHAAYSQQSILSAGGTIHSNGAEFSYSIGQVFYAPISGNNNSIQLGVQQAYSAKLTILSALAPNEHIRLYPNPAYDAICISIPNYREYTYSYKVATLWGNYIAWNTITQQETMITLSHLPQGTYIVWIYTENKEISLSHQIIKL